MKEEEKEKEVVVEQEGEEARRRSRLLALYVKYGELYGGRWPRGHIQQFLVKATDTVVRSR